MRRRVKVTKVTAYLPASVDLTRMASDNTLDVEVRRGDELLGRLLMGRGSVQWWPSGNRIHAMRKSWGDFAEILSRYMR